MQTYKLPEKMPTDAKITFNRLQNLINGVLVSPYASIEEYKEKNSIVSVHLGMNAYGPAVFYTYKQGKFTHNRFETNFIDQQTRKVALLLPEQIVEYAYQLAILLGVGLTISENFRRWENPTTNYTLRLLRVKDYVYKIYGYECDAHTVKQVSDMLQTDFHNVTGSCWVFAHWTELSEAFLLDLARRNIFIDQGDLTNLRLPVKA